MSETKATKTDESIKLDIGASSIIDLKAELFRKQEEFKKHKLQNSNLPFVKGKAAEKPKKLGIFDKKNAGVLQRAQKDYEEKLQEEDKFEKSRKMLEAKAKMYDQMTQGNVIPDEDGSGRFLVDFEQKALDQYREEKQKKLEAERKEEERDLITKDEDIPPPSHPGEEWVEYTDSLGRSRRCMREDLDDLIKQDKSIQSSAKRNMPEEPATLLSQDMKREILRQKWEKDEEENMKKDTIHYADVQFDEIRAHGTGYYKLSGDEEVRKEQFDTLSKLREQTIKEREKKDRLKEKRKAMLDARLAKVKQRKRMRDGVTEEEMNQETEEEIGPKIEDLLRGSMHAPDKKPAKVEDDPKKEESLSVEEKPKKDPVVREWDKGKQKFFQMSGAKYMEERRQERIAEFAPPTSFYDTSSELPSKTYSQNQDNIKTKPTLIQSTAPESYASIHSNVKVEGSIEKKLDEDVKAIPLPADSPGTTTCSEAVNYGIDTPLQQNLFTPVSAHSVGSNFMDMNYPPQMNEHPVIYNPSVPPPNTFQYIQPPFVNSMEYVPPPTFEPVSQHIYENVQSQTFDHVPPPQQSVGAHCVPDFQQSMVGNDKIKIIDTRNVKNKLALETGIGDFVVKSSAEVVDNVERSEDVSADVVTDTNSTDVNTLSDDNVDVLSMPVTYSSQPVLYKKDTK